MLIIQTELRDFTRLRIAPSGQYLLIGDGDTPKDGEGYEVWHLPAKKRPTHKASMVVLRGMEWHPQKDELYVPKNVLELSILGPSGKTLYRMTNPGWVQGIAFNAVGNWLVTHSPFQLAGWYRKEKQWRSKWIIQTPSKQATKAKPTDSFETVTHFPDGKRFLALVSRQHLTTHYSFTAHFQERDTATGNVLAERDLPPNDGPRGRSQLTISPDSAFIIGHYARSVYLWSTETTKPARRITVAKKDVREIALHPSGRWLVVVCDHPEVTVWDTTTWKTVCTYDWQIGRVQCVTFSTDGCIAAAGGDEGNVAVWDWDL